MNVLTPTVVRSTCKRQRLKGGEVCSLTTEDTSPAQMKGEEKDSIRCNSILTCQCEMGAAFRRELAPSFRCSLHQNLTFDVRKRSEFEKAVLHLTLVFCEVDVTSPLVPSADQLWLFS